jgi:hypothetical protein
MTIYYFLDGDHSRNGIKADFDTIEPYILPGAKVMFHDYPAEELMTKYIRKSIVPLAKSHKRFNTERGMIELEF